MTPTVVEPEIDTVVQDMPVLEIQHCVCCEDITKTICERTVPEDETLTGDEPITCVPCLEIEYEKGAAACPKFVLCAHMHCTPYHCVVRPGEH